MVGIFPNDASIVRLVGANDDGAKRRVEFEPTLYAVRRLTDSLRYFAHSAVRSGTLSTVYLSLSGLWTYTTSGRDPLGAGSGPESARSFKIRLSKTRCLANAMGALWETAGWKSGGASWTATTQTGGAGGFDG